MKTDFGGYVGGFLQICTVLAFGWGTSALGQALNLPPGTFTPTVTFSTNQSLPAFATVQFTTLPAGYDLTNQTYLAWCADFNQIIEVTPTVIPGQYAENDASYQLFNTYPPAGIPTLTGINNANFPLVNWLLNHKSGASGTVAATTVDIQEAIWFLLGGSYFNDAPFTNSFNPSSPTPAAQQLVSDAQTFGTNFVPGPGQVVAILLDGVSQPGNPGPPQSLLIEVTVPARTTACSRSMFVIFRLS